MSSDDFNIPKVKEDIVFREEDDGAFLFDPITDNLRCVNETGAFVFRELDGKNSIDDIVKKMKSIHPEIEEDEIKKDVISFVDDLKVRGFLVE
jgi:hypothetical protein